MIKVNTWLNSIQDSLLPPTCILCDNKGFARKDLCFYCLDQLVKNTSCCYQCGCYLKSSDNHTLCGQCLKSPPDYERTVAPFVYQGIISYLIKGLKFDSQYKNARLLGMLFTEQLPQDAKLPECIIPVPLHKNRYRERGFNQSIEIARTVGKQLAIPLELKACIRHRDTPHQVSLPAKDRHNNIKNAFSVVKTIQYSHVALLDDVMTTGATVREIARILKTAGVEKIEIWACARAVSIQN
jgi:ComF family protein